MVWSALALIVSRSPGVGVCLVLFIEFKLCLCWLLFSHASARSCYCSGHTVGAMSCALVTEAAMCPHWRALLKMHRAKCLFEFFFLPSKLKISILVETCSERSLPYKNRKQKPANQAPDVGASHSWVGACSSQQPLWQGVAWGKEHRMKGARGKIWALGKQSSLSKYHPSPAEAGMSCPADISMMLLKRCKQTIG